MAFVLESRSTLGGWLLIPADCRSGALTPLQIWGPEVDGGVQVGPVRASCSKCGSRILKMPGGDWGAPGVNKLGTTQGLGNDGSWGPADGAANQRSR